MKRSVLLLATMMVSAEGFSQSNLKGPKAKNATPVELAANALPIRFYDIPSGIKGPEAKNLRIWEKVAVDTKRIYVRRELDILKGPKAKNKKVWKD